MVKCRALVSLNIYLWPHLSNVAFLSPAEGFEGVLIWELSFDTPRDADHHF